MTRLQVILAAVVAAVVLALGGALYYEHTQVVKARAAQAAEAKAREAAQLTLQDELVAKERSEKELLASLSHEKDLLQQVDELRNKVPDVVVKYVARLVTKPGVASGPPEPPTGRPCILSAGDVGEVRCTVLGLETKLGNLVIRGKGEAYRLEPKPVALLFASDFDTKSSTVERAAPPPPPQAEQPSWSLMAGVEWARVQGKPTDAYVELDRKVLEFWKLSAWVTASLRSHDLSLAASDITFVPGARAEFDFR